MRQNSANLGSGAGQSGQDVCSVYESSKFEACNARRGSEAPSAWSAVRLGHLRAMRSDGG